MYELLETTPVDTSKAISNWQVSLGSPSKGTYPAYAEGKKGSTKDQSIGRALIEGNNMIERKKPEDDIYIHNDLDYIMKLEEGHSPQNSGFVERAVQKGKAIAEVLGK